MIAIIDYGAGNMQSVEKALRHLGCQCQITADPGELAAAQAAVLPGVGAFGDAMGQLRARGWRSPSGSSCRRESPFSAFAWDCRSCLRRARSPLG